MASAVFRFLVSLRFTTPFARIRPNMASLFVEGTSSPSEESLDESLDDSEDDESVRLMLSRLRLTLGSSRDARAASASAARFIRNWFLLARERLGLESIGLGFHSREPQRLLLVA